MLKQNKSYYQNRELSWLSFNDRVLQEANDPSVPLLERLKFLGIFSSNLDEFFRVRVGTLRRMLKMGTKYKKLLDKDPEKTLSEIQKIVLRQQEKFEQIYTNIQLELATHHIFIINEEQLSESQGKAAKEYFEAVIRPHITPLMLNQMDQELDLRDKSIYLAIELKNTSGKTKPIYSIIQVPTDRISRFMVLPSEENKTFIILLDDVIRFCLPSIFYTFDYNQFSAYTIKVTRDAELDFENDIVSSYVEQLSKSIKKRQKGSPVRFIYDEEMPESYLKFLMKKLKMKRDDNMIPGGRYHNFRDFMKFPSVGSTKLRYKHPQPISHDSLPVQTGILQTIAKKDVLLHYPYHSFHYITDLLREASIDPNVVSIKMTLYRLAKHSNIVNALINAVKNGKEVTVIMELQARFDEEANIFWANKLAEEGAKVLYGVPGYKVHSKLCLVTRKEGRKYINYANISTGNFNEDTSTVYSDTSLLTANPKITDEVEKVFEFFNDNTRVYKFKSLMVSPRQLRSRLEQLIINETENAENGKPGWIIIKLNSIVDKRLIDKLYQAAECGVKVKLIIRGICTLNPELKILHNNIEAISIVDKYLEHSRVLIFCNNNNPLYFISSADWMERNLDHRIEVSVPILDKKLQKELLDIINIQLNDNVKARTINATQNNMYRLLPSSQKVRAQDDIYKYLQSINVTKN